MEVTDRMGLILEGCPWARGTDDLLRVIPELAEEIPPMECVPASRMSGEGIPLPGASAVLAGVATFVCGVLEDTTVEDFLVDAGEASVRDDPVVHALVSMWRDSDRPGSRVLVLPALAAAWSLSGIVGSADGLFAHLPGPLASRCMDQIRQLNQADEEEATHRKLHLASRLAARIGAAITLSRSGGVPVPATGLVRRIVTNPLVSLYRLEALDPRVHFSQVCQLLRAPMDPAMIEPLFAAGDLAWSAVAERLASRRPRPVDRLLGRLAQPGRSTDVLLDPVLGPGLLRCLADLVDVRALRGVGFDARIAKRLLNDQALRPLSAAWADVVAPVRIWQVLSAVVERVVPLWAGVEGDEEVTEPRAISARWSLRVPKGLGVRADHAIVAVRFSDLVESAQPNPERSRTVTRRVWAALEAEFPDSLCTWMADCGIAAFPSALTALRFAEAIRNAIPGPEGILDDTGGGSPVVVRPGLRLAVGLDWGRVDGGTDGASTWLEGPAVTGAIHLTGGGPPTKAKDDPLEIRAAASEDGGLRSEGIVGSPSFVQVCSRSISGAVHHYGDETNVAGADVDFRLYPVSMWWEREGTVRFWVGLGAQRNRGPAELVVMNRLMFRDIHRRDQGAADTHIPDVTAPSPVMAFADDETEVDVAQSPDMSGWDPFLSGDRPAPKRSEPGEGAWDVLVEEPDVEVEG